MDPPLGLKAVVLTAKSVLLTWTDISLGDSQRINDNRYYTIAYNPKTSHKRKYINSTDLNAHIEDLKPDTEYEFSVKVIKGRRSSPPSMSIFVRTHEAGIILIFSCWLFSCTICFIEPSNSLSSVKVTN